jgi:tryptophan synthase alpha chain
MSSQASNRIDRAFARLRANHEKGFVAYISGGDPDPAHTVPLALALEAAGVDILELGVPFSDPLADGPVNQAAASRALAAGSTVSGLLNNVRELRTKSEMPIVLFTYLNPIYAFGFERFLNEAAASGVDGVLILDLPPDEIALNPELRGRSDGLKMIRLIAPNTPPERIKVIAAGAEGFIYYVTREGVTGEQQSLSASIAGQVEAIRAQSPLPVAVGFGISTPDHARAAAQSADAVVVGSAIVRQIGEIGAQADLPERIGQFVRPLVEAVKSVKTAG